MKELKKFQSKWLELTVILVYIVLLILVMASKSNFHVDELLSYGLSNNDSGMSLYVEEGEHYDSADRAFWSYLKPDKRFDYKNVWINQINDVHPPLYYVLLHTICSLFPNSFSYWYAGIINIVFAVLTLLVVKRILKIILEDKQLPETVWITYALSSGIISPTTFLRMYVMALFWVTLLTYLIIKAVKQGKISMRWYFITGLVTILGALTHYYCIVYAVMISVVLGIYMLLKRQIKVLLGYCITMGCAGMISYLCFPAMITHMFSGYRGKESIRNLKEVSDYWIRLQSFSTFMNKELFGGLLSILVVVLIIFAVVKTIKGRKLQLNAELLIMGTSILGFFFLVSAMAVYQTNRYMYPIYAVSLILGLVTICRIIENKRVIAIIFFSITVGSFVNTEWIYLYHETDSLLKKASEYSNVECLCIYGYTDQILPSYMELKNYKSVTFAQQENFGWVMEETGINTEQGLVIVVEGSENPIMYVEAAIDWFGNLNQYEQIGTYSYGTSYYIYE